MIYYSKVIKISVSANCNSPYYFFYIYLSIFGDTKWKEIYSSKKCNFIYYHSTKNKAAPTAQSEKGDARSAQNRENRSSQGTVSIA